VERDKFLAFLPISMRGGGHFKRTGAVKGEERKRLVLQPTVGKTIPLQKHTPFKSEKKRRERERAKSKPKGCSKEEIWEI